jgi:hypothetical protein
MSLEVAAVPAVLGTWTNRNFRVQLRIIYGTNSGAGKTDGRSRKSLPIVVEALCVALGCPRPYQLAMRQLINRLCDR